ncbi:hypothetical protein L596_016260 [Steinernema carpocapsae]|uniref:Uncharacterized protein n=1 Tax=Steinernema carpocapsae TaxID=34508 RepID=A0A4U5NIN5_STECR|nr:hypothetical protein L596_016260 [Steinernema carpocapsae]
MEQRVKRRIRARRVFIVELRFVFGGLLIYCAVQIAEFKCSSSQQGTKDQSAYGNSFEQRKLCFGRLMGAGF